MSPARLALALGLAVAAGCAEDEGDLEPTPPADAQWSRRFGDAARDTPLALAVHPDGRILVVGTFEGTIDLGGGAFETDRDALFVTELSPDGAHRWSRAIPQTDGDVVIVRAVPAGDGWLVAGSYFGETLDLGGGPIVGTRGHNGFVVRLQDRGAVAWQFGLRSDVDAFVTEVVEGLNGEVWVGGRFNGTLTVRERAFVSNGDFDVFVLRVTPDGRVQDSFQYGGAGLDAVTALAPRPGGGLWLAGLFEGTLALGEVTLTAVGERDAYLASLTADGQVGAVRALGTADSEELGQLALAPDGDLLLAGNLNGPLDLGGGPLPGGATRDVFVARWSPAFEHRWSLRFSGPDFDVVRGLTVVDDGRIAVSGTFRGPLDVGGIPLSSAGASDGWWAWLSPSGEVESAVSFGAPETEEVVADLKASGSDIVVLGGIQGSADLGFGPETSAGDFDVLVAKLAALR